MKEVAQTSVCVTFFEEDIMKALVFYDHGELDALKYEDMPTPEPAGGEVLVKIEASALNHLDIWVRRGWPGLKLPKPHIGGADGAGVVAKLGAGVTGIEVGTPVAINPGINSVEDEFTRRGEHPMSPGYGILGESRTGTLAEYIVVPAASLLPMPDGATFDDTAAAQLVFLTAWRMLMTRSQLRAGETVLIVGAGGGVNTAALQIAKLAGAEVFALTSTEEKMEKARQFGADHVINYKTEDWVKRIQQMTHRRGVDVVVDNVGRATWAQSILAARRGGRIITVGNTSGPQVEMDMRYVFFKQLTIIGSTMGNPQEFRDVMNLVWAGRLRPIIDRVMPLSEGRDAQALMERGEQFGKIVLKP
jgi:NADPH2:quinone reductase